MPDGISAAVINGETYLLTANDGDSRAWQAGSETDTNEIKDKTSPVNGIRTGGKVTWFDANQYDGLGAGVGLYLRRTLLYGGLGHVKQR